MIDYDGLALCFQSRSFDVRVKAGRVVSKDSV